MLDFKEIIKQSGYPGNENVLSEYVAILLAYLTLTKENIQFTNREGELLLILKKRGQNKFEIEMPSPINEFDYFLDLLKTK